MTKQVQSIVATIFGITFVVAILSLAVVVPHPTGFQLYVFRIVLALAAAGVAATIPGAVNVEVGTGIRAGGAIAVFVLLYFFNPAQLITEVDDRQTSGSDAQAGIRLSYQLYRGMKEGRAIIYINNREVGTLFVDEKDSSSSIDVILPKPGRYEYSVQARMVIMGIADLDIGLEMPYEAASNGRGTIEVEPGKEFILTTNNVEMGPAGNTWYATLTDQALERR